MEIYYLIVIFVRILLVLASILLFIFSIKKIKKQKIIAIALMFVSLLNIYFMFFHNQIQVSPVYNEILPSGFYEEFKEAYNQNIDLRFFSEENFQGSFYIKNGKIDSVDYEKEKENIEYHIEKYVYLERNWDLLLSPLDYNGKMYIYSEEDDKTLVIEYEMQLKDADEENALFSVEEYISPGVESSFSLDKIEFFE